MSSRSRASHRVGRATAVLCGVALCAGAASVVLPAAAEQSGGFAQKAGQGNAQAKDARGGKAKAAPVAGAAGIGDPDYPDYGNGGYDVDHYGIDVTVTPATGIVEGTTTIQATATQALTSFNLDLVLKASTVTVDGQPATFSQPTEHELTVTPAHPLAQGQKMTVAVTYAGNPGDIKINNVTGWVPTSDGAVLMGEPEGSAWWYPANDHPRDKATFDIDLTVPKGLQALSVGTLVGTDHGDTTDTWHWKDEDPITTYAPFAAVGTYDITQGTTSAGIPWLTAVVKQDSPETTAAKQDVARVPEVIDWLSKEFGAYPFSSTGAVVFDADFYALEASTRPLYPRPMWKKGSNISLVVHEQAHQWFGDSVSTHNWREMWLNEGFATWSQWRWDETHDVKSAAQSFKEAYEAEPETNTEFWDLVLTNPGPGHEFDWAMYSRGAMTVQALRTKVGDQKFDAIVRGWVAHHRYCTATVQEFIDYAEQMSHQDLKGFFTAWLSTPGKPKPSTELGFPAEMVPAS